MPPTRPPQRSSSARKAIELQPGAPDCMERPPPFQRANCGMRSVLAYFPAYLGFLVGTSGSRRGIAPCTEPHPILRCFLSSLGRRQTLVPARCGVCSVQVPAGGCRGAPSLVDARMHMDTGMPRCSARPARPSSPLTRHCRPYPRCRGRHGSSRCAAGGRPAAAPAALPGCAEGERRLQTDVRHGLAGGRGPGSRQTGHQNAHQSQEEV